MTDNNIDQETPSEEFTMDIERPSPPTTPAAITHHRVDSSTDLPVPAPPGASPETIIDVPPPIPEDKPLEIASSPVRPSTMPPPMTPDPSKKPPPPTPDTVASTEDEESKEDGQSSKFYEEELGGGGAIVDTSNVVVQENKKKRCAFFTTTCGMIASLITLLVIIALITAFVFLFKQGNDDTVPRSQFNDVSTLRPTVSGLLETMMPAVTTSGPPTQAPTQAPTRFTDPTLSPTGLVVTPIPPFIGQTPTPTGVAVTVRPTNPPTQKPTPGPTVVAEPGLTNRPTQRPIPGPTPNPTSRPTPGPTPNPTSRPTPGPTPRPTPIATPATTTNRPTQRPTPGPTPNPTPAVTPSTTTNRPTQRLTPVPTPRPTPLVTNPAPTPSSSNRFQDTIVDFLFQDSNGINAATADSASVQKAVEWLGNEANAAQSIPFPLDRKYLQRFGILILYFSVNPNVQTTNSDNALLPNRDMRNQDSCSWTGMRCNENGMLTRIRLAKRQFDGRLPVVWGFFPKLRTIDLSKNKLKGSIPADLFENALELEELYLYKNQLSGSISPKIGNLWLLRRFHLSHNSLTGSIPKEIASTADKARLLRYFNVHRNQMTGTIPSNMRLRQLFSFDLGNNAFSGTLPPDFGTESVRLRHLYLDYNGFSGTFPSEVLNAGDGRLITLFINNNEFTGTFPGDHKSTTAIAEMTIQKNNFASMTRNATCELDVFSGGELVEFKSNCLVCRCGVGMMCRHCIL
ncbi:unnamed protein product [Cylindrotheca closterium]|uniref:Leucine-rich repeat-containing N-terminal plant-type domain-containing protein n=1 Tax=Cylindrotheca closterium TaxID=2856 RepID=A0AAD2G4R8_9STRA|nr:unnamed protein product [Cylindrotheca closterium]